MIPSRSSNPFATCWTRPGRLAWLADTEPDARMVIARLDDTGRGALVGPHGSGKSTLLEAVAKELLARGNVVQRWTINGGRRERPRLPDQPGYLLVDGYEQLAVLERWRVRYACKRNRTRLLATTHVPSRLPTIARVAPNPRLARTLFARLTSDRPTPVTVADLVDSFRRQNGNLREVWFELYDRHERLVRRDRRTGLSPEVGSAASPGAGVSSAVGLGHRTASTL